MPHVNSSASRVVNHVVPDDAAGCPGGVNAAIARDGKSGQLKPVHDRVGVGKNVNRSVHDHRVALIYLERNSARLKADVFRVRARVDITDVARRGRVHARLNGGEGLPCSDLPLCRKRAGG